MKEELRDCLVRTLIMEREKNHDLCVLVSDSTSTCRIAPFMDRFPDSLIDVGIAEQNLVGMAAGLSLGGMTAVTANAAPFLLGRANEQVKNDICYSETNVKLVGLNPGFAYGSLGPTHHCLDDISTTLALGNIRIFCPCDPVETDQITAYALNSEGPVYIRLDSGKTNNVHGKEYRFLPGEPVVIKEGKDVTIITLGTAVHEALKAADELAEKGYLAEIISLPSIRPLNPEKLLSSLGKTGCALTVEEHNQRGGIGSLVGELILDEALPCNLMRSGVTPGEFAPPSPREDIKEKYGLNSRGITENCLRLLSSS